MVSSAQIVAHTTPLFCKIDSRSSNLNIPYLPFKIALRGFRRITHGADRDSYYHEVSESKGESPIDYRFPYGPSYIMLRYLSHPIPHSFSFVGGRTFISA